MNRSIQNTAPISKIGVNRIIGSLGSAAGIRTLSKRYPVDIVRAISRTSVQHVFSTAVPVSCHTSSYNAEMYALAHSLTPIARFINDKPTISLVKLYSTSNGAIKTIFNRSPHPSQLASCLFCHKMIHILTCRPNTKFQLIWTPSSHKTLGLKEPFKKAKLASKSRSDPILDFSTKSEVKEQIKRDRDK